MFFLSTRHLCSTTDLHFDALCHTFHLFPKNAAFKHSFTTLTSLKDKFMAVWTHGSAFADVVSSTKQNPFSLLCQLMHLSSVLISMPSLFPSSLLYNCICPRLRKIKSLKKKKKKCFYSTAPVKVQQHWLFQLPWCNSFIERPSLVNTHVF